MAYPDDPGLRERIVALLGATWPHVPPGVELARTWGADWCEGSTPVVTLSGDMPIAVVGVIEIPLVVDGEARVVAGVHGVCTHPAYRRRGAFADAMRRALYFSDQRYDTSILWTEEPAIYERFGFARVEEHALALACAPRMGAARAMDLDEPSELARLRSALSRRTPVSPRIATRDRGWHFLIDAALWRTSGQAPTLWAIDAWDVIVATHESDDTLYVHDVIAETEVPLDAVLEAIPTTAPRMELTFGPPWGGVIGHPITHPMSDVLMVRGAPLGIEAPFALSPLSRC